MKSSTRKFLWATQPIFSLTGLNVWYLVYISYAACHNQSRSAAPMFPSVDQQILDGGDEQFPLRIELVSGMTPAVETMPHSQQELIDIIQRVKRHQLTINDAETLFVGWKQRNKEGHTKSFKEKKVTWPPQSPPLVQVRLFITRQLRLFYWEIDRMSVEGEGSQISLDDMMRTYQIRILKNARRVRDVAAFFSKRFKIFPAAKDGDNLTVSDLA